MIKIFIGVDPNKIVAYHVLVNSIMRNSKVRVSITPLILSQLPINRKIEPDQSTEFSFTRFLVPYLCDYEGYAIFMDCDMLLRCDIEELMKQINPNAQVSVVKHDYVPKHEDKFLDLVQTKYERKNWTSVMVFNNSACRVLTPEYVNNAPADELRKMQWADDIHGLPVEFNHLVGEYEPNPNAKIVHYTQGTPCFAKYRHCEFAKEWYDEFFALQYYNRIGEYSLPQRIAE